MEAVAARPPRILVSRVRIAAMGASMLLNPAMMEMRTTVMVAIQIVRGKWVRRFVGMG